MWFSLGETAVRYGNITFPYMVIAPQWLPWGGMMGWHGDCNFDHKGTRSKDWPNP